VPGPTRLLTVDDLTAVAEPPGTLLIELPQRDLVASAAGGYLPLADETSGRRSWPLG
jgi:hypothetical protein